MNFSKYFNFSRPLRVWGMLLFLFLVAFFGLRYAAGQKYATDLVAKKALNTLQQSEYQCTTTSEKVFHFLAQKKEHTWKRFNRYYSDLETGILILRNDSLLFWNNNRFPFHKLKSIPYQKAVILFPAGQPLMTLKNKKKNYTVVTFVHLTTKKLPYGVRIKKLNTAHHQQSIGKKYAVSIAVKHNPVPPFIQTLLLLLYASIVLILAKIILQIQWDTKIIIHEKIQRFHLFWLFVELVILRTLQFKLGYPALLKPSFWTTLQITSITGFKTPADLLMNFLLFLLFLSALVRFFKKAKPGQFKITGLKLIVIQIFVLGFPLILYSITEKILQNAGLTTFQGNIYFNSAGIVRLLILLVVNLLLYIWTSSFVIFLKKNKVSFLKFSISLLLIGVLYYELIPIEKRIIVFGFLTVLLLAWIIQTVQRETRPYFHAILTVLLLSLSAAYLLNINLQENRNARQKFAAALLTQKQDPYLQYLLKSKAKNILKNPEIIRIIRTGSAGMENQLTQYLDNKYFKQALSAYTKQVTICAPGQQLEIQPENRVVGCDNYFKNLGGKEVESGKNFQLYLINNTNESIYYLARFHFSDSLIARGSANIYIEFYTNIIPKGLGYPKLLQNKNTASVHLSGYSFAFYQQGKLEYKFGDFLYPIDISNFKKGPLKKFFTQNNYTHYMVPVPNGEILIVSRPKQNVSDWLLPFSLLFILSGIVLLIFILFKYGKKIKETFSNSFSSRLQLTIFSTLITVYAVLTAIILYYFNINTQQTINNNLKEKTHSVMIELQNKLLDYGWQNHQNRTDLQPYLQKLSMIFFSDINLYNNGGILTASSRPEIFNNGLQSRIINPKAYYEIEKQHKLFYLGKEKIKQVEFYSSYAPFISDYGQEAGIINLPYFAKQSEIQRTYYEMLANLINLFVITGMLAMLLMVYLSKLLTKPLNILQNKIGSVSIEKQNEKIEWKRKDEIGKLIEAYNEMVEKLEESAHLLKVSEREKAWREMAQQIAHEIRNPLTPMKLNVQYLQKVYAEKDPAFNEKFQQVSKTLIDQIDTLNEVVNMFSDFAKTRKPENETSDLLQAIKSTITLFKKSYQVKISLETSEEQIKVKLSVRDLFRVLNNLLKNSVQSMEKIKEKEIKITVEKQKGYAEIKLSDNGKGISKKDAKHIFQPYFTTKSKGTGLGLAIVKNLIKEAGGDIRFTSEKGKGTTFILHLPLAEE